MRGLFLSTAVVLAATGSAAAAPSPLDGVWTAKIMPEGSCATGGELTLNLTDTRVIGAIEDPSGTLPVQGLLNGGIGSFRMGNSLGLARFNGGKFTLDYRLNRCSRASKQPSAN